MVVYTAAWANGFNGFSPNSEIDLQAFTVFFDTNIAERDFIYTTTQPHLPSFTISTEKNQLPHLMALQYWNNLQVKQAEKQHARLLSGEWDLDFLRNADMGSYKEFGGRIDFLPYLYTLLYNYSCTVNLLSKDFPSPFTRRKMDMLFQKKQSNRVNILELREKSKNVFVPSSITIYNKNANALKFKSLPIHINNVTVVHH